jgi:hypothetical protein
MVQVAASYTHVFAWAQLEDALVFTDGSEQSHLRPHDTPTLRRRWHGWW